ncbi:urease accessory protein UreD [Streptomyces atrovirens]|uniref:Urease accessory protein UreD n=1 Tax=Streptomyces atrovirens TaxID=285556 RepID=A0ABW0DKP1_9ACTN
MPGDGPFHLPRPLTSGRGSTLHQTHEADLAATSRFLLREEQLLGRTAEPSGYLSTRLTVRRDGRPVLDQHTVYGAPAPTRLRDLLDTALAHVSDAAASPTR